MTNVFNASFDDLLAQAGVATGQMTTAPKAEEPKEDVAAPTPVPNFDDLFITSGYSKIVHTTTKITERGRQSNQILQKSIAFQRIYSVKTINQKKFQRLKTSWRKLGLGQWKRNQNLKQKHLKKRQNKSLSHQMLHYHLMINGTGWWNKIRS